MSDVGADVSTFVTQVCLICMGVCVCVCVCMCVCGDVYASVLPIGPFYPMCACA